MSNADKKSKRPSKKTEMLEVRVAPEEKAAFLEACRQVGRSASEVIRDAMRAYSDFGPMARLPRSGFMLVSAFIGASAGAYALIHLHVIQKMRQRRTLRSLNRSSANSTAIATICFIDRNTRPDLQSFER
jgi:hypothetical protein